MTTLISLPELGYADSLGAEMVRAKLEGTGDGRDVALHYQSNPDCVLFLQRL